ncbi:MAG: hypothetical protein Q6373_012600 [Candidatus Sigynarchaeota archaeon]
MKKRIWMIAGTCLLMACLLMQSVQASSSSVGFSAGNKFVWRWTYYTYKPDLTVDQTTIRYKLMNVTGIVAGSDHLNISARFPYANQSDYEAHGVDGTSWGSSSALTLKMLDANQTYWYQGFYCKSGVSMLNLLGLGDRDKYTAFLSMHILPVPEMFGMALAMSLAKAFSPSTYWETSSASISLALLSYVSGTLDIAFGYQDSGHWTNATIKCTSSFTYSIYNLVLDSLDTTFEMTQVKWNSTTSSYQTQTARSRHVYEAVYPSDLASYIPVEWFIGIGGGVLIVVIIAVSIHKHKKK